MALADELDTAKQELAALGKAAKHAIVAGDAHSETVAAELAEAQVRAVSVAPRTTIIITA